MLRHEEAQNGEVYYFSGQIYRKEAMGHVRIPADSPLFYCDRSGLVRMTSVTSPSTSPASSGIVIGTLQDILNGDETKVPSAEAVRNYVRSSISVVDDINLPGVLSTTSLRNLLENQTNLLANESDLILGSDKKAVTAKQFKEKLENLSPKDTTGAISFIFDSVSSELLPIANEFAEHDATFTFLKSCLDIIPDEMAMDQYTEVISKGNEIAVLQNDEEFLISSFVESFHTPQTFFGSKTSYKYSINYPEFAIETPEMVTNDVPLVRNGLIAMRYTNFADMKKYIQYAIESKKHLAVVLSPNEYSELFAFCTNENITICAIQDLDKYFTCETVVEPLRSTIWDGLIFHHHKYTTIAPESEKENEDVILTASGDIIPKRSGIYKIWAYAKFDKEMRKTIGTITINNQQNIQRSTDENTVRAEYYGIVYLRKASVAKIQIWIDTDDSKQALISNDINTAILICKV